VLNEILKIIGTALPALFIGGVFIYIAVQIIEISVSLIKFGDSQRRVKKLLNNALILTSGERVTVIKFHGHKTVLEYIPYSFLSCQYEAAKKGKQPANQIIYQIPISEHIKFLKNLRNGHIILDPQHPNPAVSEEAYRLITAQGEAKGLYFILKNSSQKPVGFVSLKKNDDFTEDDFKIMSDLAVNLIPFVESWDDRKVKTGIGHFLFPGKQLY